ncbi:MAG: AAA family ATPase [Rickettsiales bacterium]
MNYDFFASNENSPQKPFGYDEIISKMILLQQESNFMPVNLFTAAEGTGKRKLCEYLIAHHLGQSLKPYSQLNLHPDLLIISPDQNKKTNEITIEQTRKIKNFTHLTAAQAAIKIILIDALDNLNLNAANSILKILEEPQQNCFFYLICHNPNKILDTILSRTHKIILPKLSQKDFFAILAQHNIHDNQDILYEIFPNKPGIALNFINNSGLELLQDIENILTKKQHFAANILIEKYNFKNKPENFENILACFNYLTYKNIKNNIKEARYIEELNDFINIFNHDFHLAKKLNLEKDIFIINHINKLQKFYV